MKKPIIFTLSIISYTYIDKYRIRHLKVEPYAFLCALYIVYM